MDLNEYYDRKIKEGFYEFYNVPDLLESADEIIFILESGHSEEVINHKPLCGDSGKKFSKYILGKEEAVGFLDKSYLPKIGFMESSPIPLCLSTYEHFSKSLNAPIQKEDYKLISQFIMIKNKYFEYYKSDDKFGFKNWLNDNLSDTKLYEYYEQRLNVLWNKNKHFVICGFIAQAFFEKFIGVNANEGYKAFYKPKEFIKKDENYILYMNHPVKWNELNTKMINEELKKNRI